MRPGAGHLAGTHVGIYFQLWFVGDSGSKSGNNSFFSILISGILSLVKEWYLRIFSQREHCNSAHDLLPNMALLYNLAMYTSYATRTSFVIGQRAMSELDRHVKTFFLETQYRLLIESQPVNE
jgi:hypothetical protein